MENVIEVRYAGVVVGRSTRVRDWDAAGAFIGFAEPLPTGTPLMLKGDGVEQAARVIEVVESADPAIAGMRVAFGPAAARPAPAEARPVTPPPAAAPVPAAPIETASAAPSAAVTGEMSAGASAPESAEGENSPGGQGGGGKRRRRRR